jgi:dipeptidase E
MKSTLIMIGGGEIGNGETLPLDQEVRRFCPKEWAHVLFLPTAAHDVESYTEAVKRVYEPLGCEVESLCLYTETPTLESLQEAMDWADIIYIGGGNTRDLLRRLKETGFDHILLNAMNKREDLVVAGYSAGASMWCRASYADCDIMDGISNKMVFLKCFNYLPFVFNPHAQEEDRQDFAADFAASNFIQAYSLDKDTGIVIKDKKVVQVLKIDDALRVTYFRRDKNNIVKQKSL